MLFSIALLHFVVYHVQTVIYIYESCRICYCIFSACQFSLRIVQDISNVADMVNVTALWVQLELMLSTIAGSHGELRSSMDSRSQCGQRNRGAYNAGDDGIS